MKTLLQRLSERAQSNAEGRLRPLAASPFLHVTSPIPDIAEEVEADHAQPVLATQEEPLKQMAKGTPISNSRAESRPDRPAPSVRAAPYSEDLSPLSVPHELNPSLIPVRDVHDRETGVPGSDQRQLLMPKRQDPDHEAPTPAQAPRRLDEVASYPRDEQEPGARRTRADGAEPRAQSFAKAEAPEVHIHIGRIDVRSAPPPSAVQRSPAPRPAAPSLDDYLARRRGTR